jgi:hypothetical protein
MLWGDHMKLSELRLCLLANPVMTALGVIAAAGYAMLICGYCAGILR